MGDWNAVEGEEENRSIIGKYGLGGKKINQNDSLSSVRKTNK